MQRLGFLTRSCAVAVGLVLAAGSAGANIFAADGIDPRVIQPRTGAGIPYGPIGLIETFLRTPEGDQLNGTGTGFLVSPCHVLTNHHVANDDEASSSSKAGSGVSLLWHAINADGFTTRGIVASVEIQGSSEQIDTRDDWALLRLDECVGTQLGWLTLVDLPTATILAATVTEAGYSGDRDQRYLWLEPECRMFPPDREPTNRNTFFHDCSSTGGNSGSPVFLVTPQGLQVVGIDEGEYGRTFDVLREYTEDRANIAVDIRYVLPQIRSILTAAIGSTPNPAARAVGATNPTPALLRELSRHGCFVGAAPAAWSDNATAAASRFNFVTGQADVAGVPAAGSAGWTRLLEVTQIVPTPACTARAVLPFELGTTARGSLAPADYVDVANTFADCFVFTATGTGAVDFRVTSDAFDTFLEVGPIEDERNCSTVALANLNDDAPGAGTNSALTVSIKPGLWLVRITSFRPGETGSYILTAGQPGAAAPVTAIK